MQKACPGHKNLVESDLDKYHCALVLINYSSQEGIAHGCSHHEECKMDVIKVKGTSRTSAVAGAIAGVFRENHLAEVQAIGASAVNQAVKAIAIAREYMAADNVDICCRPEFAHLELDGEQKSAMKLAIIVNQK